MLASEVMDEAAVWLNDASRTTYNYTVLFPLLASAWDVMQRRFELNSIPIILVETPLDSLIDVAIGDTELTVPSDFIRPIHLKEKLYGSTDLFVTMVERQWLPNDIATETLRYWYWTGDTLKVLGATTRREVLLHYVGSMYKPIGQNSPIVKPEAKTFLSKKTAALAAGYLGSNPTRAQALESEAEQALNELIRTEVKNKQGLPVRRQPFRSRFRSHIP